MKKLAFCLSLLILLSCEPALKAYADEQAIKPREDKQATSSKLKFVWDNSGAYPWDSPRQSIKWSSLNETSTTRRYRLAREQWRYLLAN
jgi:hypothetical protein